MYEGYSTFGGIEVVNNQRCWQLATDAGIAWYLKRGYPELEVALNAAFNDITTAPWFDVQRPELSEEFLGVYGLVLQGTADSVRSVSNTQNSGDGSVLGAPRKGSRGVRVRATLLAKTRLGLEYGQAWLHTIMATAGCGQSVDCDRADVLFFGDVPTDPDEAVAWARRLKYAGATSGPFVVNEYASRGVYAVEMEWSWTTEKPYVYGPEREITLDIATGFALIQDSPINWVPYPSAKLEEDAVGYTRPVIARNMNLNPSLTANATGYTATRTTVSGSDASSYLAGARVTTIGAFGDSAYEAKIAGNGSTSASGVATLQIQTNEIDCTSVPASRLVQASVWADKAILAGTSVAMTALTVELVWLTAGGAPVGSPVALTADARASGLYTSAKHEVPATATKCVIRVRSDVTWSSGNTDETNGDARLYVDMATLAVLGSV